MREKWQSVIETGVYLRKADGLLDARERADIVGYLARSPEAGDLVPGGGGIRKMRFAAQGRGKSGGVRVIYYYHDEDVPLFLLTVYGKSQRANLTRAELNTMAKAVKTLADNYGG